MPSALKVAVVLAELGSPNVTVPGPLTLDQVEVRVPLAGRPSSVTDPFSDTDAGSVTVLSGPAFTTGAALVCGPVGPRFGADSSYIAPSFSVGWLSLSTPRTVT